jgi:hypothetical protein
MQMIVPTTGSCRTLLILAALTASTSQASAATISNVSGYPKWNASTGQIETQTTFTLGPGETFLYVTMEIVDAETGQRVIWQRDDTARNSRDTLTWNFKDPNKVVSGRKYTVYITMYYKRSDGTTGSVTASGTISGP